MRLTVALLLGAHAVSAQTPCAPTPLFRPCDIAFELSETAARAHPRPYLTVQLQAEMRSPEYKTYLVPAFWDGGRRLVIRFAPDEVGKWTFRVTSNVPEFNGKVETFNSTDSDSPGFLRPANGHHWRWTRSLKPHLWMGDTCYRLGFLDRAQFDKLVATRSAQKFNHLRFLALPGEELTARAFSTPDDPAPEYWQELDRRVAELNKAGLVADVILGSDQNHLAKVFPSFAQRERYVRYILARYAAFNVTWQLVQEFEEYEDARNTMKQLGSLVKKADPHNHPRTAHTVQTSSPLAADGWMDYLLYQSSDVALGGVERQVYALPMVNSEFAYEDSGRGKSHPHHVDAAEFRRRLWRMSMTGQYPTFGNTGTYWGRNFAFDPAYLDSPGAKAMTGWFDFMSRTRYWDLEPYFDVAGGVSLALPGTEYIVYAERPGPVEVQVEKHEYQIYWLNVASGEIRKEKKDWKGETYTAQTPGEGEWVLHLSRDGRKEGMLRSYKFESRPFLQQEIEIARARLPFTLAAPADGELPVGTPIPYSIKLNKETRASKAMQYVIVGESVRDGQGARVLASGAEGRFTIPKQLVKSVPATLSLRVYGLNGVGKLYAEDHVFQLK
jgi:hypothetical protein